MFHVVIVIIEQNRDIFKQKRAIYLEEENEIKEQDDKGSEDDKNYFPEGVRQWKKLFRIWIIRKLNLLKKYISMMMEGVKTEVVKKPVNIKKK